MGEMSKLSVSYNVSVNNCPDVSKKDEEDDLPELRAGVSICVLCEHSYLWHITFKLVFYYFYIPYQNCL